jgi:hypothetical protein
MNKNKNLLITVSGGRSSAMMAHHIHTHEKYRNYNKLFCFANTGMERPETIEFLKNIVIHWGIELHLIEGVYSTKMGVGVKYKAVQFNELDMNARVFEESIAHVNKGSYEGLPNSAAPYCSHYMKVLPIDRYAKDYFGSNKFVKSIGFRAEDMPKRISWAEIKEEKKRIFPLLTDFNEPVNLNRLHKFWEMQPFKLQISSKMGNCELCWKKSDRNLVQAIRYGTRFVDWWQKMEKQYNNTSFRGRKSINDYVIMAKQGFEPEIDFGQEDYNCVCSI